MASVERRNDVGLKGIITGVSVLIGLSGFLVGSNVNRAYMALDLVTKKAYANENANTALRSDFAAMAKDIGKINVMLEKMYNVVVERHNQ